MNDLVSSWSGNEWRNASGDEVANRDLWERLLSRALIGPVSWNVARDRADSRFCEEAKALARSGAYRSTMTDRATGSRALRRY
jgi:ribonuclease HI